MCVFYIFKVKSAQMSVGDQHMHLFICVVQCTRLQRRQSILQLWQLSSPPTLHHLHLCYSVSRPLDLGRRTQTNTVVIF